MGKMWSMVAGLLSVLVLALVVHADDKKADAPKEVTLKGTITCAKCDLKVEGLDKCATVIKVKEGDKDVIYYLDDKSHKDIHPKVCKAGKPGSVTGSVSEKDGKKTVTCSKVELDKE